MKKHRIALFFLILYYAWFVFVGWHIATSSNSKEDGMRSTAMIILSLGLSAVYLVAFLVKMFASKNSGRENFLFVWLVTLPIVVGALYFVLN